MFKSLIAGFDHPNMEEALATIPANDAGLIAVRPWVDFVVRQFPDSVLFEDRLKTAAAIKPLFTATDDGPEAEQNSDDALKSLFDKMDEDNEGAVAKSETYDVFLMLLPQFDMKTLREEYDKKAEGDESRTVNKDQFVEFVLAHCGDDTAALLERIGEAVRAL